MAKAIDYYAYLNERLNSQCGLADFEALLQKLGSPQEKLRCFHMAGTNGKGSTSAFFAQILREQGWSVGLFTSPALKKVNERIRINGEPVSDAALKKAAQKVRRAEMALDKRYPGFSRITATAFVLFQQADLDAVVLEVGMGGRMDATNVCTSEIAFITRIGMDHMEYLGESIEAIAREKCGIIKEGQRCVVAHPQDPQAMKVIEETCAEKNVDLVRLDSIEVALEKIEGGRQYFRMRIGELTYRFQTGLLGRFQLENVSAAVLAARSLGLDAIAIHQGIKNVEWPGRMEFLDGTPPFLLDGAHNPQSAQALVESLGEYYQGRSFVLITAVMKDKDWEAVIEIFARNGGLILTVPMGDRSVDPKELARVAQSYGAEAMACENCEAAYNEALQYCAKNNEREYLVLVSGSLYLVGEMRDMLLNSYGYGETESLDSVDVV